MNKKGFTLVELLSVIVIIGVLASIGILSVNSIRKSILDKEYQNVKTKIELAAESYYQDSESTSFYVQTLIDEGYLKADDASLNIYNPIDKSIMNCYIINIDNDGNATLDDINKNENCENGISDNYDLKIIINGDKNNNENNWYNKSNSNITLVVTKNDGSIDESLDYTWTTDLNPNTVSSSTKFNLNNLLKERGGVINDMFYVQGVKDDKIYKSAGKRVKIDAVSPKIDSIKIDNLSIEDYNNKKNNNELSWVKERQVTVEASDLGSGIKEYLFSENENCRGTYERYDKSQNNVTIKKTFAKDGKYYLCIKDEAGNTLENKYEIDIAKVDGIAPKCYYSGESTSWAKQRVISYGCKDDESGCAKIIVNGNTYSCTSSDCQIFTQNKTYTGTTKTTSINASGSIGSFTIIDKNNNETKCPITSGDDKKTDLNIYTDNTSPTVTINSMSYANNYLTVNVSVTDSHSGANNAYITFNGKTSSTQTCNDNCQIRLNIGSITEGTVYAYGTDKVGNTGSASKKISKVTGNMSNYDTGYGQFTHNISVNGNVLYSDKTSTYGTNITCNSNKQCTGSSDSYRTTCRSQIDANTTSPTYDACIGRGTLKYWGKCTADDDNFTNRSGVCDYSNGNYAGNWFTNPSSTCSEYFGAGYEEDDVKYECSNCSSYDPGVFWQSDYRYARDNAFTALCKEISNAPNFGHYSKTKSVKATKYCSYASYEPNKYCSIGTLKNGTCYSCPVGSTLSEYSCVSSVQCTKYRYEYTYIYYVY